MRGLLPLFVKEKAMDHHLREIADCLDEVLRLLDSYAHVRSPEFSWCLMRRTVSVRARPFSVRAFASPGSEAKRCFADEPPPRSRRGSVVIAFSRDPLDVPDHHVLIRRDVLPDLEEKRLLRHGHRADEAKQIMPLGHPQRHGGEGPAERQKMPTIPKSREIGELDPPTRQPQRLR